MTLINALDHKVAKTIRLDSSRMRPVNCVLCTDAGLNLLREEMVKPNWVSAIYISKEPRRRSATNQKDEAVDTVMLQVRIEETHVRAVFGNIMNLTVLILLGASYIGKFVRNCYPPKKNSPVVIATSANSDVHVAPVESCITTGATNGTGGSTLAVKRRNKKAVSVP